MRAVIALLLLGGCVGGGSNHTSSGATRPAAIPKLSELPTDPERRNAILDSAHATPGPEQRKGMTRKERKAETFAATAAAIIGDAFSSESRMTFGTSSAIDENLVVEPRSKQRKPASVMDGHGTQPGEAAPNPAAAASEEDTPSNADLVPWIKLK